MPDEFTAGTRIGGYLLLAMYVLASHAHLVYFEPSTGFFQTKQFHKGASWRPCTRSTAAHSALFNQVQRQPHDGIASKFAYAMQIDARNAADRSPAAQHQRELETMSAREQLGRETYAWERHYDQTHRGPDGGVDSTKIMADYGGALKQLNNDQKAFTALDKTGQPVIQQPVREAYSFAEQEIAASKNPLQQTNDLIMSSNPAAAALPQFLPASLSQGDG